MDFMQIITKKRDGQSLSEAEINYVVSGLVMENLPDYQIAAWLMAIYFQGMTDHETTALTMAMANSGDILDLNEIPGIKVDKHSTGGVADTTTLVLAPLVASAGVPVAKMSGRGLGFTGGTIDKLESISGFNVNLTPEQFKYNLGQYGIAIMGQTAAIAPADGKLYALRDVTATVDSIPLIASSIMSKKIAAGADKILLDVKVGTGAFMKNKDDAILLANSMVRIGNLVGKETIAFITSMNQPLGMSIGNSLEVEEAIRTLQGQGPKALEHVCLTLGSYMLKMAGLVSAVDVGYSILRQRLGDGTAVQKMQQFIVAQGGDSQVITDTSKLPQAAYISYVKAPISGFIQKIDAAGLGLAGMHLGAGRRFKGDSIDLAAGITIHHKVGDKVAAKEVIATIYSNDRDKLKKVEKLVTDCFILTLKSNDIIFEPLILGYVDIAGFHPYSS